jgi:WD40 repeat protein
MVWKKSGYGGGGGGTIFGGGGKVNVESWRCVYTLRGHGGDVLDLAWSPNDSLLATASIDNTVIVWNGEKFPEMVTTLRSHTGLVKGVVFDPVGKYLASQSDDKSLRVWRISNWREEAVITAPFEECGATTHVLRPGWSPDGSMLVSAHAMNGGGPTAQIIERGSWNHTRDFVGHKKAISCVRFNKNILQKNGGTSNVFVSVALGSRDRSISIWSTNIKRPLVVISEVFDQSVLDLSWSRDGKILLACSMDGSVAAVMLNQTENGLPLSETKTYDLLSKSYGKSFGIPPTVKAKKTNGTVIVENPELLKAQQQLKIDSAKTNGAEESSKQPMQPRSGPSKQIEARTSDGRRRITPIFIPPDAEESQGARGVDEFGSSSTQEKSKIEVEKMDGIVHPNVSPGKEGRKDKDNGNENGNDNGNDKEEQKKKKDDDEEEDDDDEDGKTEKKKPDIEDEIPVNVIRVKKAPGPTSISKEPTVNTIAVKKKPSNGSGSGGGGGTSSSSSSSPKISAARKNRIISDSSDSASSSSSDADSSDDSGDDDEEKNKKSDSGNDAKKVQNGTASSSSSASAKDRDEKMNAKKKDISLSRPGLFGSAKKRKHPNSSSTPSDDFEERAKKRGRPPGSGFREPESPSRVPPPAAPSSMPPPSAALPETDQYQTVSSSSAAANYQTSLPTLTIDKAQTVAFTIGTEKLAVAVHNNYKSFSGRGNHSVHLLKCQRSEGRNWHTLLPGEVGALAASEKYLLVACKDATFNVFTPAGARKFPPIMLPAALSNIDVDKNMIAAVTETAKFFLWEMKDTGLKAILRNECILSLLQSDDEDEDVTVSKLSFSSSHRPVIVTSAGKAYIYSDDVGTWLKMTDHSNAIMAISSYPSAPSRKDSDSMSSRSFPLAALSKLAPSFTPLQDVPSNFRTMANLAHCEAQRISAEYLESGTEYKFWLLATVKHLTKAGSVEKLREILNSLSGPSKNGSAAAASATASATWDPKLLGQDKRSVLKEALQIVAGNVELQRLFGEYNDLVEANEEDLIDVQSMLE